MKRKKVSGNGMVKNAVTGVAAGLAVTVLGALIGAYLIHKEVVGVGAVGYIAAVAVLAAAFLTAAIGGKGMAGKERLLSGSIAGSGLLAALLMCNIVFFGGRFSGVPATALLILACCVCAFLLFGKKGNRKKFKIPKL